MESWTCAREQKILKHYHNVDVATFIVLAERCPRRLFCELHYMAHKRADMYGVL